NNIGREYSIASDIGRNALSFLVAVAIRFVQMGEVPVVNPLHDTCARRNIEFARTSHRHPPNIYTLFLASLDDSFCHITRSESKMYPTQLGFCTWKTILVWATHQPGLPSLRPNH